MDVALYGPVGECSKQEWLDLGSALVSLMLQQRRNMGRIVVDEGLRCSISDARRRLQARQAEHLYRILSIDASTTLFSGSEVDDLHELATFEMSFFQLVVLRCCVSGGARPSPIPNFVAMMPSCGAI
jgi:hypothetical protein